MAILPKGSLFFTFNGWHPLKVKKRLPFCTFTFHTEGWRKAADCEPYSEREDATEDVGDEGM